MQNSQLSIRCAAQTPVGDSLCRDDHGSELIQTIILLAIAAMLGIGLKYLGSSMVGEKGLSGALARSTGDGEISTRDRQDDVVLDDFDNDESSDQGSGGGTNPNETQPSELESKLKEIEDRYDRITKRARQLGWNVAAGNLDYFRTGQGKDRTISAGWLQKQKAIQDAVSVNEKRFESEPNSKNQSLETIAKGLADGASASFNDHWDRQVGYTSFEGLFGTGDELFYASGDSTLTTSGGFNMTRHGDKIEISGRIEHNWKDRYDWHAGLSVTIPGEGSINDQDALLLETHRGAAPYDMNSNWGRNVSGTFDIETGNFEWK